MKAFHKTILIALCAVVLVIGSVMGTLAYFTDTKKVENTFTVGKVEIELDEGEVNPDGQFVNGGKRVQENVYHLVPGQIYNKDPRVTVKANSEDMWLFVKVENKIKDIEADSVKGGYINIEEQIAENGWKPLSGAENVYYREHAKKTTDTYYPVFKEFKIDGNKAVNNGADASKNTYDIADYATNAANGVTISVTAYGIQKAGFENDRAAAWDAMLKQLSTK